MTDGPCFENVVALTEVSELFGCHLRVWERGDRVIVLAGNLKDLHIPQGRIEESVDEIARLCLPHARPFEYYTYDPGRVPEALQYLRVSFDVNERLRRSTAMVQRVRRVAARSPLAVRPADLDEWAFSNPRWHPTTPDGFRQETGVTPDEYEAGLYTADAVRAYVNTGVATVPWDPYNLRRCLAEVKSLDALIAATGDERLRELLTSATCILSGDTRLAESEYARARERPDSGVLARQYPELPDNDWALLDRYREMLDAWRSVGQDDLDAIRELLRGIKETGSQPGVRGVTLTALEHAERMATDYLIVVDADFRKRERCREIPAFLPSDVLYVAGQEDRAYLETIQWTAEPGDGDGQRYTNLLNKLGSDATKLETMRVRLGHDPFGRAIAHTEDYFGLEAYVVEWPCAISAVPFPNTAVIVANNIYSDRGFGGRPAYISHENGAYDLLPKGFDEGGGMPGFTWGYGGTGPSNLERAIEEACCSAAPVPESEWFRWWLESMISTRPNREELKISVGEVRRWYKGEQSPEEFLAWLNGEGAYLAERFGWRPA